MNPVDSYFKLKDVKQRISGQLIDFRQNTIDPDDMADWVIERVLEALKDE